MRYSAYRLCRHQISQMKHYKAFLLAFALFTHCAEVLKIRKNRSYRNHCKVATSNVFERSFYAHFVYFEIFQFGRLPTEAYRLKSATQKKFTTSWQLLAAACHYRQHSPYSLPFYTHTLYILPTLCCFCAIIT